MFEAASIFLLFLNLIFYIRAIKFEDDGEYLKAIYKVLVAILMLLASTFAYIMSVL